MDKDLVKALEGVKDDLEAKTNKEIKELKDTLTQALEDVKSGNEDALNDIKDGLAAIQDHADKLDVRLQAKAKEEAKTGDNLKDLIVENFDEIKQAPSRKVELKAVGNMTLGNNLTGDQPRDYSFEVAMVPGQRLNVTDLIQTVPISGGVYTFPRESGGEGTSPATQTEGSDKAQKDYDFTMVDVTTDFLAGFAVYSRKMANNLPFLESFLPQALRRDYSTKENALFNTTLAAAVTASSQVITGQNKIEMLMAEVATLEGSNFYPNVIVVTPADYWAIMEIEKSTGAGYGLPGITTLDNGQLRINGIPVLRANWVASNKYYVGDFSTVKKIVTEGLSVSFSEHDEDNFRKNNITARVEAQIGLAIHRVDAIIYGDFTAT